MYEAENKNRPKFERGNSINSFRRTLSQISSKSVEDTEAIPQFKVRIISKHLRNIQTLHNNFQAIK